MSRRHPAPPDPAHRGTLLRVRRLVFEMLERRSMLAADTDALDGADSLVAGECEAAFGGEPDAAFVAFPGEKRIEPEIAGCWLSPPEAWCFIPPAVEWLEQPEAGLFEPVVAKEELEPSDDQVEANGVSAESDLESVDEAVTESGDDADAAPLWEGVSLEVIRSGGDDPLTLIAEPDSQGEGEEPQIVTCTGVIDWMAPATEFSTDDGSEPTLSLIGPSGDGDESVDGDAAASEEPVDATYEGEVEQILDKAVGDGDSSSDDAAEQDALREDGVPVGDDFRLVLHSVSDPPESAGSGDELPRFEGVFPRHEFARRTIFFDAGFGVPVFSSRMAISTTANSTSTAAADAAGSSPVDAPAVPDVAVAEALVSAPVRGPAATVAADVSQLFAAYASGVGQAAVDHAAASVVGGRRGARR